MTSKFRFAGTLFAVILISILTVGTEPLPPPYSQYSVRGSILRSSGLPLNNFIVTLTFKFPNPSLDSLSFPYFHVQSQNESYPGVTDTAGRFTVRVATQPKADSVAVEITGADKPVLSGPMMAVPQQGISITSSFSETQPGCSGCTKEPADKTVVVGYEYILPEQTINIPF